MGKKKTKTARQRQNKAASKLANSFAKKLGVSVESQRIGKQLQVLPDNNKKKTVHKKKKSTKTIHWERRTHKTSKKDVADDEDFAREHASVQARGHAKHGKRPAKKQTALQFDKPTFALFNHQKSTDQLIQETMQKVQFTNLLGHSSSANAAPWNGTVPLPTPVLATPTPASSPMPNTNPFAALQHHDDDEEEDEDHQKPKAALTFAPPSFAAPEEIDPDL